MGKVKSKLKKKKNHTPVSVHEPGQRRQGFDRTLCLLYFNPVGGERTDPDLSDFIVEKQPFK